MVPLLATGLLAGLNIGALTAWGLILLAAFLLFIHWLHLKDLVQKGQLLPARIVSLKPLRIAAFAELSRGEENYPALMVLPLPEHALGRLEPRLGQKLSLLASASGARHLKYYQELHPTFFSSLYEPPLPYEPSFEELEEQQWFLLDEAIQYLGRPLRYGLHYLWQRH